MSNFNQAGIRQLVSTVYDIQASRVATGNRLVSYVMASTEEVPEDTSNKVISVLTKDYARITDQIAEQRLTEKRIEKAIGTASNLEYIKDATTYKFAQLYMELLRGEQVAGKTLAKEVEKHPMWDAFFKDVKGCGPIMASICLAYFDIEKARHPSSIWKYAGLDVVYNNDKDTYEGRSMRHTEMREYTTAAGELATKKSLTYNPFVKTKLVGVLSGCFIKAGDNHYTKVRMGYLNRLQNRPDCADKTKAHLNNMANRYMVKMFLKDMWFVWRALEGYETGESYEVAKLGMKPHGYNEATSDK